MDRPGLIRDKVDIKILILFILRRLSAPVSDGQLTELALCDGSVGYFDFAECLGELTESGHIEQTESGRRITEKGERNGEILENSLPYSVRTVLEKRLAPLARAMRRDAMIQTGHVQEKDGCRVELAMSDSMGEIISLRLLCPGEERALTMEKNFRANAEEIYNRIAALLSEEEI